MIVVVMIITLEDRLLVVWWLRMRWACWMALGGGGGGGILGKTIGLLCARATATPQFCSEVDDALRWTSAAPEGPHTASRPSQSISALSILFHLKHNIISNRQYPSLTEMAINNVSFPPTILFIFEQRIMILRWIDLICKLYWCW